jgi:hypothetical protein
MAEKEQIHDEKVTERPASARTVKESPVQEVAAPRHSRSWVVGFVAIVVVVYLMLVVAGLWVVHSFVAEHRNVGNNLNTQQVGRYQLNWRGDRTFNVWQSNSDGLTTTTTNTTYTQTEGVVTAVNGDSITVAGGGKTQTIKTNSSTTYADDVKPVVNDTVVVVGTKDGDTITATQISVYN